ncbi:MAG TPA: hypothetical protein ENJ09_05050 [Planctomycetes bacterium]|nr:hypothetical protein [Planctomycetota bacterium]
MTFVDRSTAFAFTHSLRQAWTSESETLYADVGQIRAEHLLMTTQEILDTYGRPDEISPEGDQNVQWIHQLLDTETESFSFHFHRDRVGEIDDEYSDG